MSRYAPAYDPEHQPLTWLHGHAIFAAHYLALGFVVTMVLTTLAMAFGGEHLLRWLVFDSASVQGGQLWRLATYGLVNEPTLRFAIDMVLLVWFGRELEKFFGRRIFFGFYAGLHFITPLLFTFLGFWQPTFLAGQTGALAVFVAFATLHPDTALFFGLLAKWIALILVGIFALMALAANDWIELLRLGATSGFAFAFVRYQQGRVGLPTMPRLRLRLPPRNAPIAPRRATSSAAPAARIAPAQPTPLAEVDALLDKINRSGIDSLTPQERSRLHAAQAHLARRQADRD